MFNPLNIFTTMTVESTIVAEYSYIGIPYPSGREVVKAYEYVVMKKMIAPCGV